MTDTREAQSQLCWLVGGDDVNAVHLAEMMELRRQWPMLDNNTATSRGEAIADTLDVGLAAALLAIGLRSVHEDDGTHSIYIVPAFDTAEEFSRVGYTAIASMCLEAVEEILADEEWDERDRQDVMLTEALGGDATHLYAGTFAPPHIGDDVLGNWWQTLGYDSFEEWFIQPPYVVVDSAMACPHHGQINVTSWDPSARVRIITGAAPVLRLTRKR